MATVGAIRPEGAAPRMALTGSTTTPADSLWLRWHAPALTAGGDSARDPQTNAVLRLHGQAAAWRPGAERNAAAWDSVRAQTTPDTLARLLRVWPGAACSLRVGAARESVAVVARNGRGASRWGFAR